jgi:hypothetical protein
MAAFFFMGKFLALDFGKTRLSLDGNTWEWPGADADLTDGKGALPGLRSAKQTALYKHSRGFLSVAPADLHSATSHLSKSESRYWRSGGTYALSTSLFQAERIRGTQNQGNRMAGKEGRLSDSGADLVGDLNGYHSVHRPVSSHFALSLKRRRTQVFILTWPGGLPLISGRAARRFLQGIEKQVSGRQPRQDQLSGSPYGLSLTGQSWVGRVTPFPLHF